MGYESRKYKRVRNIKLAKRDKFLKKIKELLKKVINNDN